MSITIDNKKTFVRNVYEIIKRECTARGYNYPVAVLAHMARESEYGTSGLSAKYNNFAGIKCGSKWTGKSVNMTTKEEYTPGTLTTIKDNFRVYDTVEDGVVGYFDFLDGLKRYANLKNATSEINYFELLKKDGYYTSNNVVNTMGTWLNECHNLVDEISTSFDTTKLELLDNVLNSIADDVIAGKFGNGETRKAIFGEFYTLIQSRVNAKLR